MNRERSAELKALLDSIRKPSGNCQACLSDKCPEKDFIITCEICQSSIHNEHYGKYLYEATLSNYEKWRCERCRTVLKIAEKKSVEYASKICCKFCPSPRGMMKRVQLIGYTIWLHPECATWCFPIIFYKNANKRNSMGKYLPSKLASFWVNIHRQDINCLICDSDYGYKIKCNYYSCKKFYHVTCAATIGFVRDLDSTCVPETNTYIPPYCEEHLQLRIVDCVAKAKNYKEGTSLEYERGSQFNQMSLVYATQLRNMQQSAKKHQYDEYIRQQLYMQEYYSYDLFDDGNVPNAQYNRKRYHPDYFYDFIEEGHLSKPRKDEYPSYQHYLEM